MTPALDVLRRPGFCPRLRSDLQLYRGGAPLQVVIFDPVSQRRHQLYEIECMVAQQMDGRTTLPQLVERARAYAGHVTPEQVEELVIQFAALGLLANVPPEPLVGFLRPAELPGVPIDYVTFREQLLQQLAAASFAAPPPAIDRLPFDPGSEFEDAQTIVNLGPPAALGGVAARELGDDEDDDATVVDTREPSAVGLLAVTTPPRPTEPSARVVVAAGALETNETPFRSRSAVRPVGRSRRRLLIVLALCGVGVVAAALIPYRLTVVESCLVEPSARMRLVTPAAGSLRRVLFDDGAEVQKGAVIAELEPPGLKDALAQAHAEVDELSTRLAKLRTGGPSREDIARAQAAVSSRSQEVKFAEVEVQRRERLLSSGAGSTEHRDRAVRDLEGKRAELSRAQSRLRELRAGGRAPDAAQLGAAEGNLAQARGRLENLEKLPAAIEVRAPADGRLVAAPRLKERLHKVVAPGEPLGEIVGARSSRVEILVSERDLDTVRRGQPTTIKLLAYPLHRPFRGQVDAIGTQVEEKNDARFVRVTTHIEDGEGLLHEGMSGLAEIEIGRAHLLSAGVRKLVRWFRVRWLI